MIANAVRIADHRWTCGLANTQAPKDSFPHYACSWEPGQTVQGLPYAWGEWDSVGQFDRKLAKGYLAGSHSTDQVPGRSTGTDCSGFVSLCWEQERKYCTGNILEIAAVPKYNWFVDMKAGDAFVRQGAQGHIVLFETYAESGNPIIFEASGRASRVIRHEVNWAVLQGYRAVEYKGVRNR